MSIEASLALDLIVHDIREGKIDKLLRIHSRLSDGRRINDASILKYFKYIELKS